MSDSLLTVGEPETVTLHGKNLSINPTDQRGAAPQVRLHARGARPRLDHRLRAWRSPTAQGDGLDCVVWPTVTLLPSDEYTFTAGFTAGGGGHVTDVFFARYCPPSSRPPGS